MSPCCGSRGSSPLSWFVQNEVDQGRKDLNFSEWQRPQEGGEAAETVWEGSMPPLLYQWT
ncbi:MAG: heme-binding domain-containing protein [Acidimicrobiia bacterium]